MKLVYLIQTLDETLGLFQSLCSGVLLQVNVPFILPGYGVPLVTNTDGAGVHTTIDLVVHPGTILLITSFSPDGCNINIIYEEDILLIWNKLDWSYILDWNPQATLTDKIDSLRKKTFWVSTSNLLSTCSLLMYAANIRDTDRQLKNPGSKPNSSQFNSNGFFLEAGVRNIEHKDLLQGLELD